MLIFEIRGEEEPVCDFCTSPNPQHTHQCTPHVVSKKYPLQMMDGDGLWAACDECDRLIREEKWEELFDRSWKEFEKRNEVKPECRALLRDFLRTTQQQFRQLRKMPA